MNIQKIYILGDVHGDWSNLNHFINKKVRNDNDIKSFIKDGHQVEVIILQVGDFGWWPHMDNVVDFVESKKAWKQDGIKNEVKGIKDNIVKIYFCPGNHENWDSLYEIQDSNPNSKIIEILKGVYFCTFGSILTLIDDTNVMFCGGADSIDKYRRTPGVDWWSNEVITYRDMLSLPEPETVKVDWLISHTCPSRLKEIIFDYNIINKFKDPSTDYLQYILENYKPSMWWFGHFHKHKYGKLENLQWKTLNYIKGCSAYYDTKTIIVP